MVPSGKWLGAILALILACPLPCRADQQEEEASLRRSRFLKGGGIGIGSFFRTNYGDRDQTLIRGAVSLENKMGVNVSDQFGVYFLTHAAFNDFQATREFAEWVFQKDDYTLFRVMFLMWFIPLALFADSQALAGPGFTYYTSPQSPCLFFDFGGGFSSVQSIKDSSYIFGFGLFSGMGVQITEGLGFGVRALYAPALFHSGWTSSDNHLLTVSVMLFTH